MLVVPTTGVVLGKGDVLCCNKALVRGLDCGMHSKGFAAPSHEERGDGGNIRWQVVDQSCRRFGGLKLGLSRGHTSGQRA